MGEDASTDEVNATLRSGYNSPERTGRRAEAITATGEFQIGNSSLLNGRG